MKTPVGIIGWLIGIIFIAALFETLTTKNAAETSASAADVAKTPEQTALEAKIAEELEQRHRAAVAAMQTIKKSLRDPSSVVWESVLVNQDATTVCVEYRAKNGFGGMNREFALFRKGQPSQQVEQWNKHCAGKPMFDHKHSRLAVR